MLCLVVPLLAMAALSGVLILLPIYLQEVLHLGALTGGLMLLPGGLLMGLVAPGVGRFYDRHGPRWLVVPASLILLGSIVMLLFVDRGTPPWFIVVAHMILSLSLGLLLTPCITFALGAVEHDLTNHGGAILNARCCSSPGRPARRSSSRSRPPTGSATPGRVRRPTRRWATASTLPSSAASCWSP